MITIQGANPAKVPNMNAPHLISFFSLPELTCSINKPKGLYYKRTEEQYITKATIIFLFTLSELKRKRVPQKSLKQC